MTAIAAFRADAWIREDRSPPAGRLRRPYPRMAVGVRPPRRVCSPPDPRRNRRHRRHDPIEMFRHRIFSPEIRTARQAISPNRMFHIPIPPAPPSRALSTRQRFCDPVPRSLRIFCASKRPAFLATSFCGNLHADAKNNHARKESFSDAERLDRAYPASRDDEDGNGSPRRAPLDERNAPVWCPCHESGASMPTSIGRQARRIEHHPRRSRKRPLHVAPIVSPGWTRYRMFRQG